MVQKQKTTEKYSNKKEAHKDTYISNANAVVNKGKYI